MSSSPPPPPAAARQGWFDEHRRWVVGIAITAGFSLLGGGGIIALVYQDFTGRDEKNAAEVRECMKQHGLGTARFESVEEYDPPVGDEGSAVYTKTTFATCAWPRPSYADADGYSEVVALLTDGPGDSEASDASSLDRLKTSGCITVELLYTYGSQGYSEKQPPVTANLGDVKSAYTRQDWTGESPFPYPERDEIVVVHNSKMALDGARCVEAVP